MRQKEGFASPEYEPEKYKIPEGQLIEINEAAIKSAKSSEKWLSVSKALEIFRSKKLPSFPERDRERIMKQAEELLEDRKFRTKAMSFWEDQQKESLAFGLSERLMEELKKPD